MIQSLLILIIILLLVLISLFLWKSGFLMDAERPKLLLDKPVMDSKERRAVVKRLKRWREEGKLTREEFERFTELCRSEWDEE